MLTFFLYLATTAEYILAVAEVVTAGKTWGKKSMVWRLSVSFPSLIKAEKPERYPCKGKPGVTRLFQ